MDNTDASTGFSEEERAQIMLVSEYLNEGRNARLKSAEAIRSNTYRGNSFKCYGIMPPSTKSSTTIDLTNDDDNNDDDEIVAEDSTMMNTLEKNQKEIIISNSSYKTIITTHDENTMNYSTTSRDSSKDLKSITQSVVVPDTNPTSKKRKVSDV